jgi:hypothetical protein
MGNAPPRVQLVPVAAAPVDKSPRLPANSRTRSDDDRQERKEDRKERKERENERDDD